MSCTLGENCNALPKVIKENLRDVFMFMDLKIHNVKMSTPKDSRLWEK